MLIVDTSQIHRRPHVACRVTIVRYTPVYFYTSSNTIPVLELHGTPQLSRVRSVCTRPTSYLPEEAKTEGFKMYRTTVCQPGPAAGELSGPQDPVAGAGDGACCPLSKNPYQLSVIRASLPHLSIFFRHLPVSLL